MKLVKRGGKDKADQLGVIANSHLVVSNEKGRYELKIRGLQPKIFPVGKVGDKIWMRIEIDKIAPAARSAILQAVGTGADVTRAAEGFLAYGYLPGDWGKQYHAGFWRF